MSTVEVTPEYGWGWFEGEATMDVPAPFDADVFGSECALTGLVTTGLFQGWHVDLTPRHLPFDGEVNLQLTSSDRQRRINGYAHIAPEAMIA